MVAMSAPPILVLNSGSSSVKCAVYRGNALQVEGKLDGENLRVSNGQGKSLATEKVALEDRNAAMGQLVEQLRKTGALEGVAGVGYRIVHGGLHYSEPSLITPDLIAELRKITPLAPDHLPDQIAAIERMNDLLPSVPAVACFDTAFHRTMPRRAQVYGLNQELEKEGIVRYGFHGLSYSYIVGKLREEGALPEKLIVAHLGNGASMAAILNGESIDTSMGLTPTGGFIMSNRSGDMDPGVILYLIQQKGMTPDQVAELVNKEGGMKGLSGLSSDMQELEKHSPETVEVFCYQVKKFLASYMAALGGLDTLVFTGGIGENSSGVRGQICAGLERLGIEIDAGRNQAAASVISSDNSAVKVRVIKTNEELVIARNTQAVLKV